MQNFESFTKELHERPELYDSYKTFYIRMKNADKDTKQAYNAVKNTLMAYAAKTNRAEEVKTELNPNDELFTARQTIAKFVMVSEDLYIQLRIDPRSQSTKKAMFKVLDNQTIVYKLRKDNVVKQVIEIIPKIMALEGYSSVKDYQKEDYASFYVREIKDADVSSIIMNSQKEYEEKQNSAGIETTADDDFNYEDYYDEEALEKKNKERIRETLGNQPTEEDLRRDEMERKNRLRKPKLFRDLAEYGYDFVWFKIVAVYLVTALIALGLGIAYQMKPLWIILLAVGFILMMPLLVRSFFLNKYEEKRYYEVTTYIEQMLYSFRKNSKIINSLRDALAVFPEKTKMHETIVKALHYSQSSNLEGNFYENILRIIEEEYPCRRIRSLHRYMIKVEGVGGNHTAGIDALLKDRRLWVERRDAYKKDSKTVLTDIFVAIAFSVILACVIVRLMETPIVSIPSSLLYQISTLLFLLSCAFTICMAVKSTILRLNDGENEANSRKTLDKIKWLRTFDAKKEFKSSFITACIFALLCIPGIFLSNPLFFIVGGSGFAYSLFLKTPLKKRRATKRVCREIEKMYPDWLLELALLLQVDNLHRAIEKTIDTAPLILKPDLMQLDNDILANPTGIEPFTSFFDFLPLPNVHSSMLLLYSITEFGKEESNHQILELIERNSLMMDKAEKYRNEDRLSITFILKFIPMGLSSIKLMCDLVIMLLSYMAVMTGVM